MKLSNDTKRMLRAAAKSLTLKYKEPYIQKKIINHKDIETNNLAPKEGLNKQSTYIASWNDGSRLVNEERHYKRMCDAWKKDGNKGYRQYLMNLIKKEFRHVNWWDRLFSKLNLN